LVSTQVPSPPTRNEWGESWREGDLHKTRLLSPALSSFLRQEEREKCSAIGHFSTCVDTNGERVGVRGLPGELRFMERSYENNTLPANCRLDSGDI
jgi:hypothetical protein